MAQAQTLTAADLKRSLLHCHSRRHTVRDQTIINISVYAGLRAKEIAALDWHTVYERSGAVRREFVIAGSQTKGGRARTIYVSNKLSKVLCTYRDNVGDRRCGTALFTTQRGTRFSANTMCQLLLNIYKSCGLTYASSHSGRRTFITRLAEQGVNVRLLAELAGHSSITTTQRYIDANPAQLARAVELV